MAQKYDTESVGDQRARHALTVATKHWNGKGRTPSLSARIQGSGRCEICEKPGGKPHSDGMKGRLMAHPECLAEIGEADRWAMGVWDVRQDAERERRAAERNRDQQRQTARRNKQEQLTVDDLVAWAQAHRAQ